MQLWERVELEGAKELLVVCWPRGLRLLEAHRWVWLYRWGDELRLYVLQVVRQPFVLGFKQSGRCDFRHFCWV